VVRGAFWSFGAVFGASLATAFARAVARSVPYASFAPGRAPVHRAAQADAPPALPDLELTQAGRPELGDQGRQRMYIGNQLQAGGYKGLVSLNQGSFLKSTGHLSWKSSGQVVLPNPDPNSVFNLYFKGAITTPPVTTSFRFGRIASSAAMTPHFCVAPKRPQPRPSRRHNFA
jgi:hypothetical protein